MANCKVKDLLSIVGYKQLISWIRLAPKIFYKDGKPIGAIGYKMVGDVAYIASTTKDPKEPFTTEMNLYCERLNRKVDIMLVTDMKEYQDFVKKKVQSHGFTFTYEDDGEIMYSFREKRIQHG